MLSPGRLGLILLLAVAQVDKAPIGSRVKVVTRQGAVIRGVLDGRDQDQLRIRTKQGGEVALHRSDIETLSRDYLDPKPAPDLAYRYVVGDGGSLKAEFPLRVVNQHAKPLDAYQFLTRGYILDVSDESGVRCVCTQRRIGEVTRGRILLKPPLEPGEERYLTVRTAERGGLPNEDGLYTLDLHNVFACWLLSRTEVHLERPAHIELVDPPPTRTDDHFLVFEKKLEPGEVQTIRIRFRLD